MPFIIFISPFLLAAFVVWLVATAAATGYGSLARAMAADAADRKQSSDGEEAKPSFSIIVTTHNQAAVLSRNLLLLLEQDYPDFEVIVVDIASTDETDQVLEILEYEHTNLRHTRTPASARDISLQRLAITLGIRAARGTWIQLMTAEAAPTSSLWLRSFAREATDWRTLLIGAVCYGEGASLAARFELLWTTILTAAHIRRGNAALPPLPCNVALRRTAFAEVGGFATDQGLRHGAVELLANRISKRRSTLWLLAPETIVRHDPPASKATWRGAIISRLATLSHARHSIRLAAAEAILILQPWLVLAALGLPIALCIVAAVCASASQPLPDFILDIGRQAGRDAATDASTFNAAIATIATLSALFVTYVVVKLVAVGRTAKALTMKPMPLTFLWLELFRPFTLLRRRIRWLLTPENEFRKKFV